MEPHQPVLQQQVLEVLAPKEGERFADLTAGYGGHSSALLRAVGQSGFGYLYDQDPVAVSFLRRKFGKSHNVVIGQKNFVDISSEDIQTVDMILLDLGVSSPQIDTPERGFSFTHEARLDMRMNPDQTLSAYEIVNHAPQAQLAEIIFRYGDEPRARRIAASIVATRKIKPIETTTQLAQIITAIGPHRGKLHPATKTFQALRIAVNDELETLATALPRLTQLLNPGGRLAVISFHSGEDKIVKQFSSDITHDSLDEYGQVKTPARFQKVTKKAIKGDQFDNFPRARSARLRAVVKK